MLVGGLFILSAVGKITAPSTFAEEVRDYQMLPIVATNAVAYILPWVELFAGLLLVTTIWRREARLIIGVLLVVFTLAKSWTYLQHIDIGGCGCGGSFAVLNYIYDTPQGIFTNIVLLGLLWLDCRAQLSGRDRFRRRSSGKAAGLPGQ